MTNLLRELELAEDRAIHRGDAAGGVMLRDIRRGFIRGEVSAEHARIAVAAAARRIDEAHECPTCGDPITDGSGVYVPSDGAWRHEDCAPETHDSSVDR